MGLAFIVFTNAKIDGACDFSSVLHITGELKRNPSNKVLSADNNRRDFVFFVLSFFLGLFFLSLGFAPHPTWWAAIQVGYIAWSRFSAGPGAQYREGMGSPRRFHRLRNRPCS